MADEIDTGIMEFVRLHPHARIPEIGKAVKLSRPGAQRRVANLLKTRRMRRSMTVDLGALGWKYKYRVNVRILPQDLAENSLIRRAGAKWKSDNPQEMLAFFIMDEVAKSFPDVIVEEVYILLGDEADLCVSVRVKDPNNVFPFVTKYLRTIRGISNTSTCMEAWTATQAVEERSVSEDE